MKQFDSITQQPAVMGGKASIRGMPVTVGMLVGQIGAGRTIDEVLIDYPYLEREDILQRLATELDQGCFPCLWRRNKKGAN